MKIIMYLKLVVISIFCSLPIIAMEQQQQTQEQLDQQIKQQQQKKDEQEHSIKHMKWMQEGTLTNMTARLLGVNYNTDIPNQEKALSETEKNLTTLKQQKAQLNSNNNNNANNSADEARPENNNASSSSVANNSTSISPNNQSSTAAPQTNQPSSWFTRKNLLISSTIVAVIASAYIAYKEYVAHKDDEDSQRQSMLNRVCNSLKGYKQKWSKLRILKS